jgi:hypothetical protein
MRPRLSVAIVLACVLLVAFVAAPGAYASAGFGIESYALTVTEEGGAADVQAGSHPYELTAEAVLEPSAHNTSADEVKDLDFQLPPGLVIDLAGVPDNNAVGMVQMSIAGKIASATVYKLAPALGEFARFGFTLEGIPLVADISVGAGSNDGMTLSIQDLPEWKMETVKLELRGASYAWFVTLPGSCTGTLDSVLSADSWAAPGVFAEASSAIPALTGCNKLAFSPSISVAPDVSEAGEPSGYMLDLNIPQSEDQAGLASAQLEEAAVTLPEGAAISLPAAGGLQACTEAQAGLGSPAPVTCPDASKVGTVKIRTPLLVNPLEGAVYVAAPTENPFGSLLAVYISAVDPVTGTSVKLATRVEANQVTGQLTLVLGELPQLPVSGLELHFFGGARALLSIPSACGLATTTSELSPWSGAAAVLASSSFEINSGANGTPCSDPLPFSPTFQAAATNNEAGGYDSLTFLVTRADQEEQLSKIAIQAPQAVQEMFTGMPPCGEPQAAQGTCPASSGVGTVILAVGSGPDAYHLSGGVYLTGAYRGASQGLEIVVPFNAGPFELGTVVIRATEQINPETGQMIIVSDPLPVIVDGIPLRLKGLALQLDRGEFELNPDGCEPPAITGTLTSTQGSSVAISTDPLGTPAAQCNPPQTAVPVPTASGVPPSTGSVSLHSPRITTTNAGKATIKLTCTGTATCRGKLALTVKRRSRGKKKKRSKTTTIATVTFTIPPGKTATVNVELNATGRALLKADHGRLSASLTVLKSSPAPSQTHTENVHLVQQKPRDKTKK